MASPFRAPLAQWERSIRQATDDQMIGIAVEVETDGDERGKALLERLGDREFMGHVLSQFITRRLTGAEGVLAKEYRKNIDDAHMPKSLNFLSFEGSAGSLSRYVDRPAHRPRRRSMYTDRSLRGRIEGLYRAFAEQSQPMTTGSVTSIGIGQRGLILGNQFKMNQSKAYALNDLFYAVEFGTGIAENVGGAGFVRTEGPTKEHDPAVAPPGAWWVSPSEDAQGTLMQGQKGFHWLYDERTRKPREYYLREFQRSFPRFLAKALDDGLGTVQVRHRA